MRRVLERARERGTIGIRFPQASLHDRSPIYTKLGFAT
jgi:hypothetical protein